MSYIKSNYEDYRDAELRRIETILVEARANAEKIAEGVLDSQFSFGDEEDALRVDIMRIWVPIIALAIRTALGEK